MSKQNLKPYFEFAHLPPRLGEVSKRFSDLRTWMVLRHDVADPDELDMCERKLLEAKDCAVRSVLPVDPEGDMS